MRGVELEWAFRLGKPLDLRTDPDAPLPTLETLIGAIDLAMPVVEVVGSRIQSAAPGEDDGVLAAGTTLIADQAGHGLLACMPHLAVSMSDWQHSWAGTGVSLKLRRQESPVHGDPSVVMGSPLQAAQWLLESLRSAGSAAQAYGEQQGVTSLPEGAVLTTGTMTGITPIVDGDVMTLKFGRHEVDLSIKL